MKKQIHIFKGNKKLFFNYISETVENVEKIADSKILERRTPKYNLQKKVENNVDETTLRRENTIISLLVSGGINTYLKIKAEIKPDDFLSEINKTIIKTVYSEFEEGKFYLKMKK